MKINLFQKNPENNVRIDPELYEEIESIIDNSIDYGDIDSFVENAIRYKINRIKYNIENYDLVVSKDGVLIANSQKSFTKCFVCDRLFLNPNHRLRQGKRI